MVPHFGKRRPGDIAAVHVEKSAGLNDAPVRDEAEAGAAQTSPGDGIQAVGLEGNAFAFRFRPLPEYPVESQGEFYGVGYGPASSGARFWWLASQEHIHGLGVVIAGVIVSISR